ncbi:hypothetical protein BASA81_017690 [Batrachochytrium salamandrivorans]|nr:hypothetical protein BASA81_017690 [Batrachochytrium salamandrivorans]
MAFVWTLQSESLARLAHSKKVARHPKCFWGLQTFIGPYSKYSNMTCHLTKLLKKDTPFSWGTDANKVDQRSEKAFSNSSFLAHPCDSKPFILETDASDFAISGVLSQFDDLDQIRPVAFYARQMNSAERNYEIYDKELLAIVDSFKHWRHFLQGGLHPVTVLCDHKI